MTPSTVPPPADLAWFKSSYSGSQGGQCLEVALEWRKSSYSGSQGGDCVEVADCPDVVHVRDSKDPHGVAFAFPAASWASFITGLKKGTCPV